MNRRDPDPLPLEESAHGDGVPVAGPAGVGVDFLGPVGLEDVGVPDEALGDAGVAAASKDAGVAVLDLHGLRVDEVPAPAHRVGEHLGVLVGDKLVDLDDVRADLFAGGGDAFDSGVLVGAES
jgi:hypothetical protein